jgi:hypothetical protein
MTWYKWISWDHSIYTNPLRILDEDDSILSFYPREEIFPLLENFQGKVKEQIKKQLEDGYLVWLRLPKNKPIRKGDMRSIRLCYWGSGLGNPIKIKSSMFDIQQYSEYLANSLGIETSYFISAPKDCNVEIVRNDTYVVDIDTHEDVEINYAQNPATPFDEPATKKVSGVAIIISNEPHYISVYIRQQKNLEPAAYIFQMVYQVKLPKNESLIWRIAIPTSTVFLIGLILSGFLPKTATNSFFCMVTSMISIQLSKESIMTVGLVAGASIGALIALKNDPMIARTRAILFFQMLLIVIVILMAQTYFDTSSACKHS